MTSVNDKHEENVNIENEQIKDENGETKTNTVGDDNKKTNNNDNNESSNKDVKKEKPQTSENNSQKKTTCEECQKNKKNLVNALKHIKTLQGNSTKLLEFYEKVKKEKVALEENIKKSQTEITNLQDKLKVNEEEKGKLNELLKKLQDEVVDLKKNSNYTPTSETQQLDEKIKEENIKLKEIFEKSKFEIGNLENKLKLSQKEIEKYKIDFSNYRDQVKNQQRVNKDKINIYEKELKDFKEIKADYEKELKKNKVLNEKIIQLENTINELKTNETRNKFNAKEEAKVIDKEMEIKLWNLNNTVQELEQKRMQMELEKNLLFQENLRLSEKLKNALSSQKMINHGGEGSQESSVSQEAQQQRKLKEKDDMIEAKNEKYEKLKKELNEKIDQLSIYKRLIEKKTKEIRTLNKEMNNLEKQYAELNDEKVKLENTFDTKLEKMKNKYQDEINSYKYTLKYKEELHQKEKLSLFGIITRQQVEIDDFKNNNKALLIKDENMSIGHSLSLHETDDILHRSLEKDNTLTINTKFNKRANDEIEEDGHLSKSKKAKYDEINQKNSKLLSHKEKERDKEKSNNSSSSSSNRKKKEDPMNYTPDDHDLSDTFSDDPDLNDTSPKKYEPVEEGGGGGGGDEDESNENDSSESSSPKRDLVLNDELINSGQSINDNSSQDKKSTTPMSPIQKKRLKAIISIKKRVSNKKYIDIILENKEKNNILEIILNKSVDITDLKHRIPVFEQFSENVNTVMQCLKQHWHKYTSTPSMLSPPQMYVPQMWEKKESNPLDNISNKKQKEKEKDIDGKEESPYDQSYGNNEFTIRLPYYLPYPEKQALFLIWMLYQYSGKKFIDTILSTLSNDIALIKHSTKDYPYLCCITRAYILLCKNLNDYERARIFCFDLLRESSHGSEIMIHIFANIAKAWPFLLNYSGLLETSYNRNSTPAEIAAADEKLKSYEIFSDEPYTITTNSNNNNSSSGGGGSGGKESLLSSSSPPPSDKENDGVVHEKKDELDNSDYYRMKRKVKMVVRLFYQCFEVIICWLYLNMCMERKIDLNHVSVKYLYNIFIKEWKWKQPESSTADLASFIEKLLKLLEDRDIVECIKNVDLVLPRSTNPSSVHKPMDIFASIIRIHLLKSFELICSCFEW